MSGSPFYNLHITSAIPWDITVFPEKTYGSDDFDGTLRQDCDEGELVWVDIDEVTKLNLWEGDLAFLKLLKEREDFFSLKLVYDNQDNLLETIIEW